MKTVFLLKTVAALLPLSQPFPAAALPPASISSEPFGKLKTGEEVPLYTLRASYGNEVKIMPYGATVVSLTAPGTPDGRGKFEEVLLGFDTLEEYENGPPIPNCGAIAGRCAGDTRRTGEGTARGFGQRLWTVKHAGVGDGHTATLTLRLESEDEEEGYPGKVTAEVSFSLCLSVLRIDYRAVTDAPTDVNLTHNLWFNLKGAGNGTALEHTFPSGCDRYAETDESLTPTGKILSTVGTPLHHSVSHRIGGFQTIRKRMVETDFFPSLKTAGGYRHYLIYKAPEPDVDPRGQSHVWEPESCRRLDCRSTAPGVEFATLNHLKEPVKGRGGRLYARHGAFMLAPRRLPQAKGNSLLSTELRPGRVWKSSTEYTFSMLTYHNSR